MVKERDRKRDPLPKFTSSTLLIEIPELLEGTYRTHKQIGAFRLLTTEPAKFLGQDGVSFTYEYVDADLLTRRGDARAAIIAGKLYMLTFDAPRLRSEEHKSALQSLMRTSYSVFCLPKKTSKKNLD